MRYFQYEVPVHVDGKYVGPETITMSEDDIRKEFWLYWYGKMCGKYGQDEVDANWTFDHCLEDWLVVHFGREVAL